jgi:hypothetical protein
LPSLARGLSGARHVRSVEVDVVRRRDARHNAIAAAGLGHVKRLVGAAASA